MKRFQAKRDAAALNSRLVRRPIQRMVWLFLLPTFAAFCIGFIYPFLKGAFLSFCKFKLTSKWTWVGFDNYLKAFADSSFRHAFLFTALFAFVSVLFINALAFAVAYALTRGIKGSNLFRTVFFMPNLIGGIVLGYIWSMIFDGFLVAYGQSVVLNSQPLRFLGVDHPAVLAAGGLYDDHLHRRIAVRAGGYAGGGPHRRRHQLADPVEGHYPQHDELLHHLHFPDADQRLQAV